MPEALVFIDADGTSHNIATQPDDMTEALFKAGVDGRYMPPITLISQEVPEQDGARFRSVKLGPRPVLVPLSMVGTSRADIRERITTLAQALNPKKGTGTLRLTTEGGAARDLTSCFLEDIDASDTDSSAPIWQDLVLTFRAFDPYWYDSTPQNDSYTVGESSITWFEGTWFPLVLTAGAVFAQVEVDNTGDADAWPVWTITGPGDTLTLRNDTTGKSISITYTIPAGSTVVIDTRPGAKTVTIDGERRFDLVSTSSSLWPLVTGVNSLTLEMSNSSGASAVSLSYYRRWVAT